MPSWFKKKIKGGRGLGIRTKGLHVQDHAAGKWVAGIIWKKDHSLGFILIVPVSNLTWQRPCVEISCNGGMFATKISEESIKRANAKWLRPFLDLLEKMWCVLHRHARNYACVCMHALPASI